MAKNSPGGRPEVSGQLHCRRQVIVDPRSGREIWKMTDWDACDCMATYMYFKAFSGDERYVAFASNRSGRFELYRLEIATGGVLQLTDDGPVHEPGKGEPLRVWCNADPAGRELFFAGEDNAWYAVEFATGRRRRVAALSDPSWKSLTGMPALSGDGQFLFATFMTHDGCSGIARVPTAGGQFTELYRSPDASQEFSHVNVAPTADLHAVINILPDRQNDVTLSRAQRARAWKYTGSSASIEPFLVMPPGFRATHEYWGPPCSPRLYYHKKTVPGWIPASVESIDLAGGDVQVHFTAQRTLGHSNVSPDGRRMVCDVQDSSGNELYLIDLRTGRSEILCWPDSTVSGNNSQLSHVHPSFSPSGKKILYTSDKGGKAAVYIVPLES